jgi:hypothetical protein
MSLNNIKLTPYSIADLYTNNLIETKINTPQQPPAIKYAGSNTKHILLVVDTVETPVLPENELSFLTNILAACKLSLADVALVQKQALPATDYTTVTAHFKSRFVLLFNVDPITFGLPLNFPFFQLQQFNGITYLYAPSLKDIEQDKTLKASLWAGLKKMFNL